MAIVTSGLVAYYNSKQGISGTSWQNIAPNATGFNATLNSGAALQTDGVLYDGVDDYSSSTGSFLSALPITMEVWVKHNSIATDQVSMWLGGNAGNGFAGDKEIHLGIYGGKWGLAVDLDGGTTGVWTGGTGTTGLTGTAPAATTTLTHLVLTVDASKVIKLYVNGTQVQTATGGFTNTSLSTFTNLYFGRPYLATRYSSAVMYAMRLYNRALSAAEVSQNFGESTNVGLPAASYTDGSTSFDLKQNIYSDSSFNTDTKQVVYNDSSVSFDTMQTFVSVGLDGSVSFDLKQAFYQEIQRNYDTLQVIEDGVRGSISYDLQIVIKEKQREAIKELSLTFEIDRAYVTHHDINRSISLHSDYERSLTLTFEV